MNKLESYLSSEKIRLIYLQALLSNVTILAVAIIYYFILNGKVEQQSLLSWFFVICSLAVYRLYLWFSYRNQSDKKTDKYWFIQYIIPTALVGFTWSYIYLLGYGHVDTFVIFSLYMLCFGVIGAALGVLSASLPMYFVYVIPQIISLGYMLLSFDRFEANLLLVALTLYSIMMSLFAKNINQHILISIKLQYKLNEEIDVREELIQERTKELVEINKEVSYQASHDQLTGLINRREFEKRLINMIETVDSNQLEHALLYIDLDQFKIINDTCGHVAGDELLRQIPIALNHSLRDKDTLARLGGDEFGVLLVDCSLQEASEIATTICTSVKEFKFAWEGQPFEITASIGLIPIKNTTYSVVDALTSADLACYAAKDKGRNCVHVADDKDTEVMARKGELRWLSELKTALEEDLFILYYQKIVSIGSQPETEHVEILLRLQYDDRIVPPGAFIPAAERYHMMPTIDRWVINKVFKRYAESQDKSDLPAPKCTINLSAGSMSDDSLIEYILSKQNQYQISPALICFEVTETAAIANLGKATHFIDELRTHGYKFALDDFGSGMSSFAYLKNLSVDYLKIDGTFIKDIVTDPIDFSMVKSINEIGHTMGLKTIAEFVEDQDILDKLAEIGVDYSQGYHIHKPEAL